MKSNEEKLNEVINKSNEIHNFKYDYSLIKEYKNIGTKYPIICHEKDCNGIEHGVFEMDFRHHIHRKQGCKRCKGEHLSNLFSIKSDEFVNRANIIHNEKYKYPFIEKELKGIFSSITVCCPIHHYFTQTANGHLNGHGCRKCAGNEPYTTETLIQHFKEIHTIENYDYSKVVYKGYDIEVEIGCSKHGFFKQTPGNHLRGEGCPDCGQEKARIGHLCDENEIIQCCIERHNGYYRYGNAKYLGRKTCFDVTCPIHGDFPITPDNHLRGEGCPKCRRSKLETEIEMFLNKNNIANEPQCDSDIFEWLGLQSLDFYLPDYNVAIECQGIQHFQPIEKWGGEETFKLIQERDARKFDKCKEHSIPILYYTKDRPNEFYNDKSVFKNKKDLLDAIYNQIKD